MKEPKLAVMVRGIARKFYLERVPGRDDWHVRFTPPKEARLKGAPPRVLRTTGLAAAMNPTILNAAKRKAAEIIESFWSDNGQAAEKMKLRSSYPTIGELLQAYEPDPNDCRPETKWKNKSTLRKFVKDALGTKRVDDVRCDVLTEELAERFLRVREARAREKEGADEITIERARVSANSTLTQARSVIAPAVCARLYKGFKLPDFEGFRRARKLKVDRGYYSYRRVPETTISAIDRAAEEIKSYRPFVYLAYILMRYLGLRPSEVWPARWNWIDREQGQYVFRLMRRGDFVTKTRRYRDVPIAPGVMRLLEEMRGDAMPNAWLINLPTVTERKTVLSHEINSWLRRYMPRCESEKCSYNLRKHCGSEINDRYGIAAAAAFLGDTIAVTEQHYAAKARIPAGIEPAAALGRRVALN